MRLISDHECLPQSELGAILTKEQGKPKGEAEGEVVFEIIISMTIKLITSKQFFKLRIQSPRERSFPSHPDHYFRPQHHKDVHYD